LAGRHLVVTMTRGVTLADWHRLGMLDRELAIYRRLIGAGMRVTLVSGGRGPGEAAVAEAIGPIGVCHPRAGELPLPPWRWPRRYREVLATADVVKSNQTDDGGAAWKIARRHGRPLIVRCGYLRSDFTARRYGAHTARARASRKLEDRRFGQATRVQVTTEAMAADVRGRGLVGRAGPVAERVRVVPNYVETDRFVPRSAGDAPPGCDVVFVGRDSRQKNLPALLEAVAPLAVRVKLIGAGESDGDAAARHRPLLAGAEAEVIWAGQVPQAALPAALRDAAIFVLPSHYEGHPKALIEAMACGLAVVAADRPGLAEVVEHGVTGWLCEPEPAALRSAIKRLRGDAGLRARLGAAARAEAVRRYSLERVVELETQVLCEAMADG
jgi:glycosyltransferase involved in cell wall biosynthesis